MRKRQHTYHEHAKEVELREDDENHKPAMVANSHSVVDPWAMVVISTDTAVSVITVAHVVVTLYDAVWAHKFPVVLFIEAEEGIVWLSL
ncbi:MAG: hypothetical protein V2I33_23090 [Kangiellaceae bacterium]|jgi:hypothetical protein|nr:hypothetical protein [Kangiellaceae bacterium]